MSNFSSHSLFTWSSPTETSTRYGKADLFIRSCWYARHSNVIEDGLHNWRYSVGCFPYLNGKGRWLWWGIIGGDLRFGTLGWLMERHFGFGDGNENGDENCMCSRPWSCWPRLRNDLIKKNHCISNDRVSFSYGNKWWHLTIIYIQIQLSMEFILLWSNYWYVYMQLYKAQRPEAPLPILNRELDYKLHNYKEKLY